MMKSFLVAVMAFTMLIFGHTTFAADAKSLKIGVIDVQAIMQQSPQMEVQAEKLKKQFKPRQDKLTELQKSMADNDAKLKRDAAVMSQSDVAKLQETLRSQQRDMRRLEEDYMQDAQAAQQKALDSVAKIINTIVQEIAEKEHYDLIVQKNTVAYAGKRVDMTDQVVKLLKDKK